MLPSNEWRKGGASKLSMKHILERFDLLGGGQKAQQETVTIISFVSGPHAASPRLLSFMF